MTTTTLKGPHHGQSHRGATLLKLHHALGEFRQAMAQTHADLRHAAKERAGDRAFARETAHARAVAASYAQSDPRVAADIRAAIDRHVRTM